MTDYLSINSHRTDLSQNYRDKVTDFSSVHGVTIEAKAEKADQDESAQGCCALLVDYTQETTVHGVRFITGETVFVMRRVVWTIIVLAGLGLFLANMIDRLEYYFSYPKTVSVEVEYSPKTEFPRMTICNENQYKLSTVTSKGWYQFLLNNIFVPLNNTEDACSASSFTCSNGQCITSNLRCDSIKDCVDGSDELNCGPCQELELSGLLGTLLTTLGTAYRLSSIYNNTPIYKKIGGSLFLYHLHNESVWWFGESTSSKSGHLFAKSSVTLPQYADQWETPGGSVVNLTMQCQVLNVSAYVEKNTDLSIQNYTTRDLRVNASHKIEDMLEQCVWRGQKCGVQNFTTTYTDFGVCYSFTPYNDYAYDIGPTNGLTVVINSETYEYPKSSKGGLGIKIQLHPKNDIPAIQEHGFSLGPGLYTLIAIDKSEVTNLPPKWGLCGVKELPFFSNEYYSVAKCNMDDQIQELVKECDCTEFFMPQKPGGGQQCKVEDYTNCSRAAMDNIQKSGQKPTCPEECLKTTFLPTISFSALSPNSFPTEDDPSNEQVKKLKKKLLGAREIAYRVDPEKYATSSRYLHTVKQKLGGLLTLLSETARHLEAETETINARLQDVSSDCFWLSGIQRNITHYLATDLHDVFQEFLRATFSNVYVLLLQSSAPTVSQPTPPTGQPAEPYQASDWGRMTGFYDALQGALGVLKQLSTNATTFISTYPSELDVYHLRNDIVTDISQFLHSSCLSCGGAGSALMKEITSGLSTEFSTVFGTTVIDAIKTAVTFNSLKTSNFASFYTEVSKFQTAAAAQALAVKTNYDLLKTTVHNFLVAPSDLVQELYETLSPLCGFRGSDLSKASENYADIQARSSAFLQTFRQYIQRNYDHLVQQLGKYENDVIELDELIKGMNWSDIKVFIESRRSMLESILDERVIALDRISSIMNIINFWLAAQVNNSLLKESSSFWRNMNIENVMIEVNTNSTPPLLTTSPPPVVTQFWESTKTSLSKVLKEDITTTFDAFTKAFGDVESFIQSFKSGNIINADFYKSNFLQLSVYYKEMSTKKVIQQKAYEYQTLLGEVGGLMGLLLGGSVISILEIFDLCIYNSCRKILRKKTKVGNHDGVKT